MKTRTRLCTVMLILFVLCLSACHKEEKVEYAPVDFTVVAREDIPQELMTEIEKCFQNDFKLTYSHEGMVYIARGYGKQNSGGYSIAVLELAMADNAVYFDSELIGPAPGEAVNKLASCPYVVVKYEDCGKNVVFR